MFFFVLTLDNICVCACPELTLAQTLSGQGAFGGGSLSASGLTIGPTGYLLGNPIITGGNISSFGVIDAGVGPNFATSHSISDLGAGFVGTITIRGGDLSLNTGSTTYFDVQPTAADAITVSGSVTLSGASLIARPDWSFGFLPSPGTNYDLITAQSIAQLFSGFTPPAAVSLSGVDYLSTPLGNSSFLSPALPTQVLFPTGTAQSNYLVPSVLRSGPDGTSLSLTDVQLNYQSSVQALLSTDQESLIAQIGAFSNNDQIQINSTDRSIDSQADTMVTNLIKGFLKGTGVANPGVAQQAFYQIMLGSSLSETGITNAGLHYVTNSDLADATSPTSLFAQTFLNYDPADQRFSVKAGVDPNNIPGAFHDQAVSAIKSAELATGQSISKHVPSG